MPAIPAPHSAIATPDVSGVEAPTRGEEASAFESEVVAFFVDAADLLGVPKSVASLYGVLFASAEPLSFSDIETRVKFSKGSVSQGLRVLREVGAIKEASVPPNGARQVQCYEPDMELRKLILRFINQRLQAQLDSGSGRLERMLAALPPATAPKATNVLRDRVRKLTDWHDQALALLPVMKTFLNLTAIGSKLKLKST